MTPLPPQLLWCAFPFYPGLRLDWSQHQCSLWEGGGANDQYPLIGYTYHTAAICGTEDANKNKLNQFLILYTLSQF